MEVAPARTRKTIRHKLLIAVTVLAMVIVALGYCGFRGAYSYRDLAVVLSHRANEFPITTELTRAVDDLRFLYHRPEPVEINTTTTIAALLKPSRYNEQKQFEDQLRTVRDILSRYQARISIGNRSDKLLADRSEELAMVKEINKLVGVIGTRSEKEFHKVGFSDTDEDAQRNDLQKLTDLAHELPTFLQDRMVSFREEVRTRYRTWIVLAWGSTFFSLFLLVGLCTYVRLAVIRPFKKLLLGSRRVAAGEFEHRIEMDSDDELSELAGAINTGTESFLRIQRDLNNQVAERSREVVRNEQLASVGFLAAGVAHEINNPLASIAWSAEALESRLHRILHPTNLGEATTLEGQDLDTLRSYLRRIQDDAFRCKGITERLLDFSRLGQAEKKQRTNLNELVFDVIDMVQHLGQYRNRRVETIQTENDIEIWASPQEMKQVVLNLLTNALDSLPEENAQSVVKITIGRLRDFGKLTIEDNGCGMTDEVKQHMFEPFFTRRRDGRGTGLGLPITSRIVADHGGRITANSDGVGKGSRFEIWIPCNSEVKNHDQQYQAAA